MNFEFSSHAIEQAHKRGISRTIIEAILRNPQQILDDNSNDSDTSQKVYQSIIVFSDKNTYLVRVFVNTANEPYVVKTVYRTSNISKYYEGQV